MRNISFLVAGVLLLLLQENLFRVLDGLTVGRASLLFGLGLAFDVGRMAKEARTRKGEPRRFSDLRPYFSLPSGFLLSYVLVSAFTGVHLPKPIPSLVLPLILFMGVHEYSLSRGASVAFVLGYASDLIGIAPVGLFTFICVLLFVLSRGAGVRLAAQTTWMQTVMVVVFTLLESVLVLILLAIFGRERDAWLPRSLYPVAVPHALFTASFAPFVFRIAEQVHHLTGSEVREGGEG